MEYICGFCNTKHASTSAYAKCVASCAEKESRKAKLAEAQERENKAKERREKIKSLYDELMALAKEEYKEEGENTSAFKITLPKINVDDMLTDISDPWFGDWLFK